jgi:uncharacterized LabA/DUF88 family protein
VQYLRTYAYVDGYNLYHGIIDPRNKVPDGFNAHSKDRPWGNLLWLDLEKFIKSYNLPYVNLAKIKFFEAPSYKVSSLQRQQNYKNALLTLNTVDDQSFFGGEFKTNDIKCPNCGEKITHHTEKRTDVSIAVELMGDFYLGNCEAMVIIGGDTDFFPAIEKIMLFDPNFLIYIIFPPHRSSMIMKKLVGNNRCRKIDYKRLVRYQFPTRLVLDGHIIEKPIEYK